MKQFTIPTKFTAQDGVSAAVARMSKNVAGFATKSKIAFAQVDRFSRALSMPFRAITDMLRGFGLYVGGYLVYRIIGGLISIFSDFQQANANLAAIMGTTVKANKALSDQAKYLGLTTAKTATEVVGLQIELAKLGFTQGQILNMSSAVISGSIALDAALDRTAIMVGAVTRTFQKFNMDGSDTQHIMDVLSKAANDSALDFRKLETALPQVSGAANAVGVSFEETTALLAALSNAGIDASMSGTALRNIFIDSRRKGHTYQQVLGNILKHVDTLTPAFNKFGRRTAVAAQIVARALQSVKKEAIDLENVAPGYTGVLAKKRLDTFQGSLTLLKAAYQGFVLSIEDGNGPIAKWLTDLNKIGRSMLLILTGTSAAQEVLLTTNNEIVESARRYLRWAKVIGIVIASLAALKVVLIAWNIVAGIATIGIRLITAAQWAWNAAMAANPIGIVIIALIALITYVAIATKNWNDFGQAMSDILGPLGFVITLIKNIYDSWDKVQNAFKNGGIKGAIVEIGLIFYKSIITPMKQMYEILSKIPGLGYLGETAKSLGKMENILTKTINVVGQSPAQQPTYSPMIYPSWARQEAITQEMNTTQRQKTEIEINNKTGYGMNISSEGDSLVPIKVSSSFANWGQQ